MKAIIEHSIVAVIATGMAFVGYWLMDQYPADWQKFVDLRDIGWTAWSSAVSVITWIWLYRMCRLLHWLVLPIMGLLSPIVGALLFIIPYMWAPFLVVWHYAAIVFPTGIATGFLISLLTHPFRPRIVLQRNAF